MVLDSTSAVPVMQQLATRMPNIQPIPALDNKDVQSRFASQITPDYLKRLGDYSSMYSLRLGSHSIALHGILPKLEIRSSDSPSQFSNGLGRYFGHVSAKFANSPDPPFTVTMENHLTIENAGAARTL